MNEYTIIFLEEELDILINLLQLGELSEDIYDEEYLEKIIELKEILIEFRKMPD